MWFHTLFDPFCNLIYILSHYLKGNYKKTAAFTSYLLIFHGGGGAGKQMQRYMGMDEITDKKRRIS